MAFRTLDINEWVTVIPERWGINEMSALMVKLLH